MLRILTRPASGTPGRSVGVRLAVVALALAACALIAVPAGATATHPHRTYRNPVTHGYSIDFPDPSILRGKDGYWYAYSTGGPYDEQGTNSDPIKMARSSDLVHWHKLGAVFTQGVNWPRWAAPTTGFWAPDIRYVDGRYLLYYVAPDTTVSNQGFDPGIGVATAPTPAGPWTDSGAPVLPPEKTADGNGYQSVIDPAEFTDDDGQRYLYYGSYGTGIRVVTLSTDGMHAVGDAHQVASTRFEGSFVIKHGGWYYLLASSANCCAGPTTGYAVFAGRSHSPLGPFRDAQGQSLNTSRTGGTIVVAPNGNRWIGTGHNTVVTDLSGQTWLAYHAVDKNHPYLQVSPGFTMRPMLLDRLDWIDGWPTVRGGRWASDTPQPAPVTAPPVDENFSSGTTLRAVRGSLQIVGHDPASDSGAFGRLRGTRSLALASSPTPPDSRSDADVRASSGGTVGLLTRGGTPGTGLRATIDGTALTVTASVRGHRWSRRADLPGDFHLNVWHTLSMTVRGTTATAAVSDGGLGDPDATVRLHLPDGLRGSRSGVVGSGAADVDNYSVARTFRPHTRSAAVPQAGALDRSASDEFAGGLGAGWQWLRKDEAAQVVDGELTWPTEQADLSGSTAGTTGLLLRNPPRGDYIVQTKLSIDLGVDVNRNYQQGGLVVYLADNHFLRLDVVAVGGTRIVEFGKRTTFDGVDSWGGSIIGPPAATTWLRIAHTVNPANGENLYRAASSRDGRHWIWGTTWTLPAGSHPKLGLVSQASTPQAEAHYGKATSRFDYLRIYRITR